MARKNGPKPQARKRPWLGIQRDQKQRKAISLVAAKKKREREL